MSTYVQRKPDKRGNNQDRKRRKQWLLDVFGNGKTVECIHCERPLTFKTLTVDRIVPGESYRRKNIWPSCQPCNVRRGNNPDWTYTPLH